MEGESRKCGQGAWLTVEERRSRRVWTLLGRAPLLSGLVSCRVRVRVRVISNAWSIIKSEATGRDPHRAPTDPAVTPTSGGPDYPPPPQTDTHETMTIDAVQNRRRDTQYGAQHARNGVQSATCPQASTCRRSQSTWHELSTQPER